MNSVDPFTTRMVFLRIGWMTRYQGTSGGDTISGGGAYVTEHGFGHEIFNFLPFRGAMYGYVQPPGRENRWQETTIRLERLGGSRKDEFISGVLVVWVATSPQGGARVVGWYQNATLYRHWQPAPQGSRRQYGPINCGFYVCADEAAAVLLPPDHRTFELSRKGEGGFGQANILYADDSELHRDLRLNVLRYIDSEGRSAPTRTVPAAARQSDLLIRQRVEKIAIEMASAHFTSLGYVVESVEADNVGWDLYAKLERHTLRIEVKGLSGQQLVVELTPNEYKAMRKHRESYRVLVVTQAFVAPALTVFGYSPDSGQWESQDRRILAIDERVAARCSSS
jgi:hypothetical protein